MLVGIHQDRIHGESYSEKWIECLRARGVEVRTIDLLKQDHSLDQVRDCDGVMWRWAHNPQDKQSARNILYAIEHYLKIPVFPDTKTAWHYDEKIAQYYLFTALNIPAPRTWLFWNSSEASEWAKHCEYPVVLKLSAGAGSSHVVAIHNEKQATAFIYAMFHRGVFPDWLERYQVADSQSVVLRPFRKLRRRIRSALSYVLFDQYPPVHPIFWKPEFGYIYFQEFIRDNDCDTRITVIGDKAFGFRRPNRPGDFRASGSGMIDYDPAAIDRRFIKIAFQISKECGFQSMSYDFLFREKEPVVTEISYTYMAGAVHNCPGHWKPDLTWVEGQLWPQEAQVEDFLEKIRLTKSAS